MVLSKVQQAMNILRTHEMITPALKHEVSKIVDCHYKTVSRSQNRLEKGNDLLSIVMRECIDLKSKLKFIYVLLSTKFIPVSVEDITPKEKYVVATIKRDLGYTLSAKEQELLDSYKE